MPFLLVRVYFEIGVPFRFPNDDWAIFAVAAFAGAAATPSPATTSNTDNFRIGPPFGPTRECERSHVKMSSAGRAAARADDQLGQHLDVRRSGVGGLDRLQQQ